MRLFLGLEIPTQIKDQIGAYVRPMQTSPKGWENSHDYHVTMLFIGEVSEEEVPKIQDRMKEISSGPFVIEVCGLEFFPRRVMYMGLRVSKELADLRVKIEQSFSDYMKPHSKAFLPHITIKRFQRYECDHLERCITSSPFEWKKIEVKGLTLFESKKDSDNNKYHVIFHRKF